MTKKRLLLMGLIIFGIEGCTYNQPLVDEKMKVQQEIEQQCKLKDCEYQLLTCKESLGVLKGRNEAIEKMLDQKEKELNTLINQREKQVIVKINQTIDELTKKLEEQDRRIERKSKEISKCRIELEKCRKSPSVYTFREDAKIILKEMIELEAQIDSILKMTNSFSRSNPNDMERKINELRTIIKKAEKKIEKWKKLLMNIIK
jgi:isopropylmalate/homocitrate/citramalate synthase